VEHGEYHDHNDTQKNNPESTQKEQVERRQEELEVLETSMLKSMYVGGQERCQGHGRQERDNMNQEKGIEKYAEDVDGRPREQTEPQQEKDEKHAHTLAKKVELEKAKVAVLKLKLVYIHVCVFGTGVLV